MSGPVRPPLVFAPGASLVQASRVLENASARTLGRYPYQWLYPGPDARWVMAQGLVSPVEPGAVLLTATVLTYAVPTGERFVLEGIIYGYLNSNDWNEGSGDLVFDLLVSGAATRKVEWYSGISTRMGVSPINQGVGLNIGGYQPDPVGGRLEFQQRDILTVQVTTSSTREDSFSGLVLARLYGHTYPDNQAS